MFAPEIRFQTSLPKKIPPTYHIPSEADIKHFITMCNDTELLNAVLLASTGTMRIGEICVLTKCDIDFSRNTISVSKSKQFDEDNKKWVVGIPKTIESIRTIIYPKFVIDRFAECNHDLFITNPNALSKRFTKALKRYGITHCRFHDLRHYAASILHSLNVPDQYIMSIGEWKTDTVLKNTYRNVLEDKKTQFEQIAVDHFNDYATQNAIQKSE